MALFSSRRPANHRGNIAKLLILVLLILALVLWGGRWLHYRLTHVHVIDARIKTDMVSVAARLPGRIEAMPVSEGENITRQALLLELDSAQVRQDLQVISASEQALIGERARMEAELELAQAVDKSRIVRARRALEVVSAELERLRLAREKARADLDRLTGMARNDLVSGQQLADAQYRVDTAAADLHRGEAEKAAAEAELAQAQAQTLNQQVLERDLDALEARLTEIRERQQRLMLDINDHRILSPLDGVVARMFVESGEYVRSGQNLMMVYDPERVWVEANIKETVFARVKTGQPVIIEVDAFSNEPFQGRVEQVGAAATSEFALLPSPNPSGNFTKTTQRVPVRITFDEPDERLRPGLMVEVGIHVDN